MKIYIGVAAIITHKTNLEVPRKEGRQKRPYGGAKKERPKEFVSTKMNGAVVMTLERMKK